MIGASQSNGITFASDTAKICPAGHYCPLGTFMPIACGIGTYSSATQATDVSTCLVCGSGQYCVHRGQTTPGADCKAGYYCIPGSQDPYQNRCPAGYYCPAKSSSPTICPKGTYNPNQVQTSCKTCPARFQCLTDGMTLPEICPIGKICPLGVDGVSVLQ